METNKCYKYFYRDSHWDKASEHCESLNGKLAKVPSGSTNDFLLKISEREAWIGGTCSHFVPEDQKCQDWIWSDNTKVSWYGWARDEPSKSEYDSVNYRIALTNGGWKARQGGSDHGHICEVASNLGEYKYNNTNVM